MQRLMPSHHGYTGAGLPPVELLEPLIDRSDPAGGHWLWDGDFFEQDQTRVASFPWTPPAENRGVYVVARVLWAHANDTSLAHRRFRNMCGLTTCVNPAHFDIVRTVAEEIDLKKWTLPEALQLPDGTGAKIVRFVRQFSAHKDDTHILRDEATFTSCARPAMPAMITLQPAGSRITCVKCLHAWLEFDRPLEELP